MHCGTMRRYISLRGKSSTYNGKSTITNTQPNQLGVNTIELQNSYFIMVHAEQLSNNNNNNPDLYSAKSMASKRFTNLKLSNTTAEYLKTTKCLN